VVDTVSFARYTGQPNFANSKVIGSFAKVDLTAFCRWHLMCPQFLNATTGTVRVYHPNAMYTGPIVPDARKNVPITVFSFTWTDASTPKTNVNTHRYALGSMLGTRSGSWRSYFAHKLYSISIGQLT
jgi:hypothetical protein